MKEKDIPEAMRLIEKRDKINQILKDMESSDEWFLSYVIGEVPSHQNREAIRISKRDSHPLFHQMRDMAQKHWLGQYKLVKDRLTELGLQ